MSRKDIERMAREAKGHTYTNRYTPGETAFAFSIDRLEHFVALVRADERAECANECEAFYSIEGIAQKCSAAIRARGQR